MRKHIHGLYRRKCILLRQYFEIPFNDNLSLESALKFSAKGADYVIDNLSETGELIHKINAKLAVS
jgi:hypothetical protein